MQKRFVAIWFPFLKTNSYTLRNPSLQNIPYVMAAPEHGRLVITDTNVHAQMQGVHPGITVADARAIIPALQVIDDMPEITNRFLKGIAAWCIRFTPVVAIDVADGLLLDVTGCTHLWGGEKPYLAEMYKRISAFGYKVRLAMADTIGAAWAVARFSRRQYILESGKHLEALVALPAIALRLEPEVAVRLQKLGLGQIGSFINIKRTALRRRLGDHLLQRIDEAVGNIEECLEPFVPPALYQERLQCMEPISTASGITIALESLLASLCIRLQNEEMGLRSAVFTGYRIDGKVETISIGTNHPSANPGHLYKLFENKIATIEPALGIELFTLDATKVEPVAIVQTKLWEQKQALQPVQVAELLDRISSKINKCKIVQYQPAEHYWPERSYQPVNEISNQPALSWPLKQRPLQILIKPERILVTSPVPDYPPMLFRYKDKLHKVVKADGPERIEQEWWLQDGQHRDYYCVEDEEGYRYWVFRSGHYDVEKTYQWYLHGFFA